MGGGGRAPDGRDQAGISIRCSKRSASRRRDGRRRPPGPIRHVKRTRFSCTIVLTGTHIIGIRQFTAFYLRWRVRALAYLMLLEDPYPPFGDAPYPASIEIVDPAAHAIA